MARRTFLKTSASVMAAGSVSRVRQSQPPAGKPRFRTGLVAYSYRQALQAKTMAYEDLIRIAVETGTDGIDMTVYWLPNTSDDYLLGLRRLAYRNRVEIYSIGTRVRLAQPTPELRQQQLDELKRWLDVAERVGATHVRVFGGDKPAGATLDQAIGFAAETLKRGAELAGA
ncbi:MAG TPA: TIM barrel protein, partial [Vicinamibacterales bacterium]|nr:TIM barrel protein [Vicinamibacterales bacterium]